MLIDPFDRQPLQREGEELISVSGRRYPIVKGIPRFVPAENYADAFGEQWNRFPKTQLDSHTGRIVSEERLARCMRGMLQKIPSKRVLEAGSGAGRFTAVRARALQSHRQLLPSFRAARPRHVLRMDAA